ncbi:unnamed protein product [Amoebophrya sp. A120]|nr:unnamed protein product [Amoebophrya sp. A120]|eukprot:GSA120T00019358001.1
MSAAGASTAAAPPQHAYASTLTQLGDHQEKWFFSLKKLQDERVDTLPYCIRILLESAVRNCDGFEVKKQDVENILNWQKNAGQVEVPFKPARVVLQDFTGVPAVVDFAAMRDAMARLGGDPTLINPLCPADLVIDHSVQVDFSRTPEALKKNEDLEMERNKERFQFLKWGAKAFDNMTIVPPGSGIVHQVNLEYLARVVFNTEDESKSVSSTTPEKKRLLYPDSLVGTDSHTTMIDGLGIAGWGVGGIEAEAVMLGQAISMVLPEVIGFELTNSMDKLCTATDLVLTCTAMLRKRGVVGKFVEFFGPGCASLTVADRATIANMSPEYGATMGFFPTDAKSMEYLVQTGRSKAQVARIENYLRENGLFRLYDKESEQLNAKIKYTDVLHLDLSTVVPCVSGPKRPHDYVSVKDMPRDFTSCLTNKIGFKGFGLPKEKLADTVKFTYKNQEFELKHGSCVLAAITSCTNTSNPGVMLGAALLARNALRKNLSVLPYIKTSLSPGSGVVASYLEESGLIKDLEKLGFYKTGFGCQTCIGNSGELDDEVSKAITEKDLVVGAVLSGNRNFEGRVHPLTRANYLASPPLVVAYALAGRMDIDFEKEPISGNVFLKDLWPNPEEIRALEQEFVTAEKFLDAYSRVTNGSDGWQKLVVEEGKQYNWNDKSTYIHNPPFFQGVAREPTALKNVNNAYCLLNCGDSITTDHISPAGKIAKNSPAGRYLMQRSIKPEDFNSYGSRRGNDEIMARGTFANIRMINKLMNGKLGPQTVHHPTSKVMDIFDCAMLYKQENDECCILAGKEYGSGSSRDWAAKGPFLQNVRFVIAESFERIHRSNLVGMGILPLQFMENENADKLQLTGKERFSIDNLKQQCIDGGVKAKVVVKVNDGRTFHVMARLDTEPELEYFQHGGILNYVLRKLAKNANVGISRI